jgi:hypothetical protein
VQSNSSQTPLRSSFAALFLLLVWQCPNDHACSPRPRQGCLYLLFLQFQATPLLRYFSTDLHLLGLIVDNFGDGDCFIFLGKQVLGMVVKDVQQEVTDVGLCRVRNKYHHCLRHWPPHPLWPWLAGRRGTAHPPAGKRAKGRVAIPLTGAS